MQVEIFQSSNCFETLRAEWNELLQQSVTNTIFLTWEFQTTWWKHFGAKHELTILTARTDDGRLMGIAPLYSEQNALRIVGGVEVADYLDFIVRRGHENAVYESFFNKLFGDCPCLDLRNLPTASPTRPMLVQFCAQRGFTCVDKVEEVCPIIDLPTTFDGYLELLDKKQRHEVRRKMRKAYNEAKINWFIVGAEHDLMREMESFINLQKRSMADKHEFMTPAMEAFFRELAQVTFNAGWLELSFIEVDGNRAATYFAFRYNGETLLYNSGYDPQMYSSFSPGIVLLAHLIEHAIQQGHKHFDFMQGNEVYKYRMGGHDTQVHQLTVTP